MSDVRRYVIVGNGFAGTTAPNSCASTTRVRDHAVRRRAVSALQPHRAAADAAQAGSRSEGDHSRSSPGTRSTHRSAAGHARRSASTRGQDRRRRRQGVSVRRAAGRDRRPSEPHRRPAGRARTTSSLSVHGRHESDLRADRPLQSAVAVGGSFIAYELAEAFASRGVETHWLIRGPRFSASHARRDRGRVARRSGARPTAARSTTARKSTEFVRSNGVVTKVSTNKGSRSRPTASASASA